MADDPLSDLLNTTDNSNTSNDLNDFLTGTGDDGGMDIEEAKRLLEEEDDEAIVIGGFAIDDDDDDEEDQDDTGGHVGNGSISTNGGGVTKNSDAISNGTSSTGSGNGSSGLLEKKVGSDPLSGAIDDTAGSSGSKVVSPLCPEFAGPTPRVSSGATPGSSNNDNNNNANGALFNRGFESLKFSSSSLFAKASAAASAASSSIQQQVYGENAPIDSTNNVTSIAEKIRLTAAPHETPQSSSSSGSSSNRSTYPDAPRTNATAAATTPPQQSNSMADPETQSKFITSALGPLLPGEKIIMCLSRVSHVADSGSATSGVAGGASGSSSDGLFWCCVMTFYRVALFNYREGKSTPPASVGAPSSSTSSIGSNVGDNVVVEGSSDGKEAQTQQVKQSKPLTPIELAVDRAGLTRQWQHNHCKSIEKGDTHRRHVFQMPLGSMDRVEKGQDLYSGTFGGGSDGNGGGQGSLTLVMYGKDGRWIRFTTQSLGDSIRAHEALSTYAFPGRRNLGYLFAFESRREEVLAGKATQNIRFDPVTEFARMGVCFQDNVVSDNDKSKVYPWTLTCANQGHKLIPSYPSMFVVPREASSEIGGEKGFRLLKQTATFRSEGRVPALTWGNSADAASIWRCSQPKVGFSNNRSSADEMFLRMIAEGVKYNSGEGGKRIRMPPAYTRLMCGAMDSESDVLSPKHTTISGPLQGSSGMDSNKTYPSLPLLRILDLRPKTAAVANRTAGYGYESVGNYPQCKLDFWNIGNIHAVRDSATRVIGLCQSPQTNDVNWSGLVEETKWLTQIRHILNASWHTAAHVHFHRLPILIHCSHGWDRTSQVCAIAQLLLDPFYRTLAGFPVLVEKDFCAFGHPFHIRAGHGENSKGGENNSQRSPIFFQFLDCVYQLVQQFPTFFEFGSKYLITLYDHVYSCRFGTLLCDNERERFSAGIYERTNSLWDYLDTNVKTMGLANVEFARVNQVLMPPLSSLLRRTTLWTDCHLRYCPRAYLSCIPRELSVYVTGTASSAREEEASSSTTGEVAMAPKTSVTEVLHSINDEPNAILQRAVHDAETWKSKSEAQQLELQKMRRRVEELEMKLLAAAANGRTDTPANNAGD